MPGVSLPVTRPSGRALVVGSAGGRAEPVGTMRQMGYVCAEADDPYAATAELCRRPLVYRAVILSLAAVHREELAMIPALKRRFPHLEIWLTHTDGRQSALAEAVRLGADGLLSGDGLHRMAVPPAGSVAYTPEPESPVTGAGARTDASRAEGPPQIENVPEAPHREGQTEKLRGPDNDDEPNTIGEPVLTADELRALLQEQPLPPPVGNSE